MNKFLVGCILFTAALLIGSAGRTASAVYEHTVRGRAEPEGAQSPPPGFESTIPAEIPAGAVGSPPVAQLPAPKIEQSAGVFQVPVRFIGEQRPGQIRASQLIGAPVTGEDGKRIADITDLILDENYHVTAVVLSSGGVLGLGSRKVALPRHGLEIEVAEDGPRASVPLSKAALEEAPEFQPLRSHGLLSDSGWLKRKLDTLPGNSGSLEGS